VNAKYSTCLSLGQGHCVRIGDESEYRSKPTDTDPQKDAGQLGRRADPSGDGGQIGTIAANSKKVPVPEARNMNAVGLDIGGANTKAATSGGESTSCVFEIWRETDRLPVVLDDVLSELATDRTTLDVIAVTMTAELADCFQTKAEGVDTILRAVQDVAGAIPVFVWQTGAEFVEPSVAREIPLLVAAANWHGLATFLGRMVPDSTALLIDVGSTTTDIIPIRQGVPIARGLTDLERLQAGELIYSGIRRTPVCAISHAVPFRGQLCPVAAELFATMLDVYLTLDDTVEAPEDCATANGRPAIKSAARDRLAHMLCADRSEFSDEDARNMASHVAEEQLSQIELALNQVLGQLGEDCATVLVSGTGVFLAHRLLDRSNALCNADRISLSEIFTPELSEAACAFAIAKLATERLQYVG
jgi:(4-(4-[2-(gamma-L-glutamylamino)ethyl]phenoxymethyl)furan-2-yl)methanamine synthase